ncbi:MAG: YdcF family protein [Deltaproteobacteria bacterium]|nr:YdcF family protein [Deltaproteobacteria bacterium]
MVKQERSSLIYPKEREKEERRKRRWILWIILAVVVIQLIAYRQHILTAFGRYLIYQEPPQKADVIAILANWGDTIVRARGGADLYKRGLAKRIFISRVERMEGLEEVKKQGIFIPENRDLAIIVLEGLGVPLAAIETSKQEVTSTREEAKEVRNFIEKRGYKSVLLVTSKYHSRRAHLIFKDTLKEKAKVISVPSPYDSYNPEGWWKREKDWKRVILEYQKLLLYYWRKVF